MRNVGLIAILGCALAACGGATPGGLPLAAQGSEGIPRTVPVKAGRAISALAVETKADLAFAKYGVTGKGVLVAVLDRGIDYSHPDFRNANGSTRN